MPRQRTGSVTYNKARHAWIARLDWTDPMTGKRMCKKKQVGNKTEGKQTIKDWMRDISSHGAEIFTGERMTFADLAERYSADCLHAPIYEGSSRLSGKRSYQTDVRRLKTLVKHFGRLPIQRLTRQAIINFKLERMRTANKRDRNKTLSLASVNRELTLLRTIFNYATSEGWIVKPPFKRRDSLISTAQEAKRDRILSRAEEERLLAACTGQRTHLRPILICALDTAMRRGEIMQLRWADIDLANGKITVRATITKTETTRVTPITARLRAELEKLQSEALPKPDDLVFGDGGNFKRAFASTCREAGIENFRFHDCRHSSVTRLVQQGLHAAEIMAISGHSDARTFQRYVNGDERTLQRAAQAFDAFHAQEAAFQTSEFIN